MTNLEDIDFLEPGNFTRFDLQKKQLLAINFLKILCLNYLEY